MFTCGKLNNTQVKIIENEKKQNICVCVAQLQTHDVFNGVNK